MGRVPPSRVLTFFHPDYTVGFGVAPNHALRLVGCTTGRELHPALKICYVIVVLIVARFGQDCNRNRKRRTKSGRIPGLTLRFNGWQEQKRPLVREKPNRVV